MLFPFPDLPFKIIFKVLLFICWGCHKNHYDLLYYRLFFIHWNIVSYLHWNWVWIIRWSIIILIQVCQQRYQSLLKYLCWNVCVICTWPTVYTCICVLSRSDTMTVIEWSFGPGYHLITIVSLTRYLLSLNLGRGGTKRRRHEE